MKKVLLLFCFILGILITSSAEGMVDIYTGTLEDGDEQLESGEYIDTITYSVGEGDAISVFLRSEDFDTYLILIMPNGEQFDNDDIDESDTNSGLTMSASETGQMQIIVTSSAVGEIGDYEVTIIVEPEYDVFEDEEE